MTTWITKHDVHPDDAATIWKWLNSRGGIAIWESINLSNPEASWTCPVNDAEGVRKTKPNWESANEPARIITDPSEVQVVGAKEVKRFHVATRVGANGLSVKVTDGGTRRIRKEVAKAGDGAWYAFDYGDYDNAVIFAPGETTPIAEYVGGKAVR